MAERERPVTGATQGLAVRDMDENPSAPDDAEVEHPGGTTGGADGDPGPATPPDEIAPAAPDSAGSVPVAPTETDPPGESDPHVESNPPADPEPDEQEPDEQVQPDGELAAGEAAAEPARPVRPGRGRLPRTVTSRPGRPSALVGRRSHAHQTAALRESLADKEARTTELREALDALRQALDEGTAVAAVAAPPQRRRRLPWLLSVLAVAVLISLVVAALTHRSGTPAASAPSSVAPSSVTPSSVAPSSVAPSSVTPSSVTPSSVAAPTPTATLTPIPWPGGPVVRPRGAVTTGPGVDSPGTDLQLAVDPDGRHLDVYERVVYPAPGVETVTAALPTLSGLSAELAGVRLTVDRLQAQLDGVVVPVSVTATGWTASAPAGAKVTRATLLYQVGGAIVRQVPSAANRFSAVFGPLTGAASLAAGRPVKVHIDDPRVLSLYCPGARNPLCSSTSGTARTATLTPGGPALLALQVNLPR